MSDVLPSLLRRAERDSQRMFTVIAQIRADQLDRAASQRKEIAALTSQLDYYTGTVVPTMTAYLAKLAKQVRESGGDPGTLVIQPPPEPSPNPSP